jgi:hypothetical protein
MTSTEILYRNVLVFDFRCISRLLLTNLVLV